MKTLAQLYSSACAVGLPSQSDTEGFGMVILEAAACGTPAIATRVGEYRPQWKMVRRVS